ncbi:hypothetical protein Pelo_18255 [Pelomyxa schiedti]|nr:hypothetical protein Pelo_18255 [Pelomyxa schiedti]
METNQKDGATHSADTENKQQILGIAQVVWEQVVVPWVLRPAVARRELGSELQPTTTSCVLATAEAMFPLVALASRAVALSSTCRGSRHYSAIEAAAASLSPKCVAWMISHRDGWDEREGALAGRGDGEKRGKEGGRRKAREQVAVLAGLCGAGHLQMAQRFVESGFESYGEDTSKIPLWSTHSGDHDPETEKGTMQLRPHTGLEEGTDLADEFLSNRGIFHIMEQVCKNGHLGVLKWVVSALFQIHYSDKMMLGSCLCTATRNGHLHIIKWFLDTFGFEFGAIDAKLQLKNGVSDVKSFVEGFPHWKYLEEMAKCVALAEGASTDEIIEVCKWLSNRFSIPEVDFLSWELPNHHNLIKWALSGEDKCEYWWRLSCSDCGDVELGKWFVEEKGVVPQSRDLVSACSGRHDNVVFVEWLFKQVVSSGLLSYEDLVLSLHNALATQKELISQWLEKYLFSSTNARPKVSLLRLFQCNSNIREDWFEWLFTHHSCSCDIDCSQDEVVNVVTYSLYPAFRHHNLSLTLAVLKKFPLNPAVHHNLFLRLLKKCVESQVLYHVKEVLSLADFSQSEMDKCLDICSSNPLSSKVAKCLTIYYTCTIPHSVKALQLTIKMFIGLLSNNKRGCAEWLFHLFGSYISLPLERAPDDLSSQVDLATWKMMLRLFPNINREVTIQFFMKVGAATALHAQYTMSRLGLTLDDIAHFCHEHSETTPEALRWIQAQRLLQID